MKDKAKQPTTHLIIENFSSLAKHKEFYKIK